MKARHHGPHSAVDEQVLECRIQCSVLVIETAYVITRKPSDKNILLPYTCSILFPVDVTGHILADKPPKIPEA